MSDYAELMQEPPHGGNHGSRAHEGSEAVHVVTEFGGRRDGRYMQPLGTAVHQSDDFMRSEGWSVVDTTRGSSGRTGFEAGAGDAGMHAHRGVIDDTEYVDPLVLSRALTSELGYTVEQLRSVYSTGGRIPKALHGLRDEIDTRLIELAESGANMDLFGRVTGLNASTVDRALARARGAA